MEDESRTTLEFVGKIIINWGAGSDYFDRIWLEGADGYKVDLFGRLNEAIYNYGNRVAVRYWVSDEPRTKDELITAILERLDGSISIDFDRYEYVYSEWTTDVTYTTTFKVGGHDLFTELKGKEGKYLYLEVEF